ncbi:asparagine synthase-related protein, partial [Dolichospermum circinale]|uniref:asparagine synthase-related protein n=1 Tax=Dolichospermum circinale TaxID=109265 RepID=UPI001E5DC1CC
HTRKNQLIVLPNGKDIVDVKGGKPGPQSDISLFRDTSQEFETKQRFNGDKAYEGEKSINMSVEGLYGYLTTGSVPEPYTLISDIYSLAAGNWLFWKNGNTTKKQYWQINFTPEAISPPEAEEIVRKALLDSIQHHFISDVPVGIFLSGGIDSTTILA